MGILFQDSADNGFIERYSEDLTVILLIGLGFLHSRCSFDQSLPLLNIYDVGSCKFFFHRQSRSLVSSTCIPMRKNMRQNNNNPSSQKWTHKKLINHLHQFIFYLTPLKWTSDQAHKFIYFLLFFVNLLIYFTFCRKVTERRWECLLCS